MFPKLNRKDSRSFRSRNSYRKPRGSYSTTAKPAKKLGFLTARQLGATVSQAAQIAGVPERTIYDWRVRDPEFAKAWDLGPAHLLEGIEAETFRSAIEGDRQLRMFILKAHRPGTYNQRQQPPKPAASKLMDLAQLAERVRGWL